MNYTTDDFDFVLPKELIAQRPIEKSRDHSRLLVLDRETETMQHNHFFDLPHLLHPDDVIVLNDSKVFPARLYAKKPTGGAVEILLVHQDPSGVSEKPSVVWEAMVGGSNVTAGMVLTCEGGMQATLIERLTDYTWRIAFDHSADELQRLITQYGHTPIPPYITNSHMSEKHIRTHYQNVYAQESGSTAAPTAGLHFTQELLERLRAQGNTIVSVTLHVGLGTFAPVKTKAIHEHHMHSEYAHISPHTAEVINTAKASGKRIIAVGTTSVRTLESFMHAGQLQAGAQWTNMFITPGYTFSCIDGMITNFHTPRSTLLMLVSAFAGVDYIRKAYQEAISKRYRFYSFGDAMLIV